ncbi:MAG: lipase family protein [Kiritimatiellae bacterium]|jgi:triacylglycerol lipase|nr:lipase family protein [Kiritimatiellia bacterium]
MKILPNPKERDLIPPDMDYIYFEDFKNHPIEPNNLKYSPVNSWWFAECSFLAYCHPGFARMAYQLAGFDGFRFFGATGTECMVSWNNNVVIVAFRGTEMKSLSALHETATNLNAFPVPFEGGGMVHKGFLNGLDEVWDGADGLQIFLNLLLAEAPDRPLWITGHSLGGALASLCFARIPQATGLYTYGAPRVGNRQFTKLFENSSAWRIENVRDPVPLVPPDLPKIKFNFGDLGTLKFLDVNGVVLDQRPVFVLEDHKALYLQDKAVLDNKFAELRSVLALRKEKRKNTKRILKELQQNGQKTNRKWKKHIKELLNDFGLSADNHQPIFYAMKTWNALVEDK